MKRVIRIIDKYMLNIRSIKANNTTLKILKGAMLLGR
jgi:hypothetical protein